MYGRCEVDPNREHDEHGCNCVANAEYERRRAADVARYGLLAVRTGRGARITRAVEIEDFFRRISAGERATIEVPVLAEEPQ